MCEIFDIPNYPDYELHKYGDNDYKIWSRPRLTSHGRRRGGKYMSIGLHSLGYLEVRLSKDKVKKTTGIHQIVAWIFVKNPDNKPTVDHIDRNPSNNRPENLRWATGKEQNVNQGMRSNNKSGVKNVCWNEENKKWRVILTENGKQKHFGYFEDLKEATVVRDREYTRIYGRLDHSN